MRVILRKKHYLNSLILVVVLACFSAAPAARAQQVTAPTTPGTQNPQSTGTQLIDSTNTVQESTPAKLLDTADSLTIPEGTPVAPQAEKIEEPSRAWLFIPLALLIFIGGGVWLLVARNPKNIQSRSEAPANKDSKTETYSPPSTQAQKKPLAAKPNDKKKKRRSKAKAKKKK